MIYSDGVHLISDKSLEELKDFCRYIGIHDCWYHTGSKFEHYDIPNRMRLAFFTENPEVIKISPREVVKILKAR